MIDEEHPAGPPDPPRIVAAAYALAAVCALVPLAIFGGVFAGVALMRRRRPGHGAAVLALSIAATAFAVVTRL